MINQHLSQKQGLTILPQQIELLKLFHLNTLGLQHRIQEELMENPVLEEQESEDGMESSKEEDNDDYKDSCEYEEDDTPDYKTEHNNYLSDTDLPQRPLPETIDFRTDLKEQARIVITDEFELKIAEYLIDCLNDHGMLDQNLSSVSDEISFQMNKQISEIEIESVRNKINQLEPKGVGCTSIREYLIQQLDAMDQNLNTELALQLLENYFKDLSLHNFEKIKTHLNVQDNELQAAIKMIKSCQLNPMQPSSLPQKDALVFDFIITQHDNEILEVSLFRQWSSTLLISPALSSSVTKENKETTQYLKNKLTSARWFVSAIKQRESTMLHVMKAIVDFQTEYFKDGDIRLLKPMILKDIADRVGIDISTASRITCNKYADTHFGNILLKDLFSKGIENKMGEAISNRVIQNAIAELINAEDKQKPYSDQQLVSALGLMGFNIARRTVAKYRDLQQIPIMQLRMLWN